MPFVEEINPKNYNPNFYYTSLNAGNSRVNKRPFKNGPALSSSRSTKRINYSLADLEAKLYATRPEGSDDTAKQDNNTVLDKFTQNEVIKSKKRFMELDTENFKDRADVATLLSTLLDVNRDKIEEDNSSNIHRSRSKFEIPKNLHSMFRCTRPPTLKRKNTNRIVALKKTLTIKRNLNSYIETLNPVTKHIIFNNVYNKKYFKVLPLIIICSVCGGMTGISGCVSCGEKVCSLNCFNVHNETRCIRSNR